MTLQQEIDFLKEKHQKIINTYPDISTIEWKIKNVPYEEWNKFRRDYNDNITKEKGDSRYIRESNMGQDIYFFMHEWNLGVEKMNLMVISERVKFETSINVIKVGENTADTNQ